MTCEPKKFKTERESCDQRESCITCIKLGLLDGKLEENDNITSTSSSNERKHSRNVMMFDSNKNFPSLAVIYI